MTRRNHNRDLETGALSPSGALALRPQPAADAIGVSLRTLWGLSAPRGPIPCVRIGSGKRNVVLYPVADLQKWLSEQAAAGVPVEAAAVSSAG